MLTLTFSLTGQIPSGKNAVKVTRKGHRYPNQRFKAWREQALAELRRQAYRGYAPFAKPVTIIVDYTPADHRRRDLPGMLDALCHLLEVAEILADDVWVHQCIWETFAPDHANAGVIVTIRG